VQHDWFTVYNDYGKVPRTLANLTSDAKACQADPKGVANAKYYHNSIQPPIITTPIEHNILPSPLHVFMGLTIRVWRMLLAAARRLDADVLRDGLVEEGTSDQICVERRATMDRIRRVRVREEKEAKGEEKEDDDDDDDEPT